MFKRLSLSVMLMISTACASAPEAVSQSSPAPKAEQNVNHETAFQAYLQSIRPQILAQGVSTATIDRAFSAINYRDDVVALDRKQPSSTRTFDQYINLVIPQSRVNKARRLYNKNRATLSLISSQYGVQPQYIVALWGVESNFGENMGNFSVIESLATLAYEGRRRTFFQQELIHALKIIEEGHIGFEQMKGSWAGAMGQTQFMPSSFFNFAQDYNRDGHADIWHTKVDAFASIANYLSKSRWQAGQGWGRRVSLPKGFSHKYIGLDEGKTIGQWKALGVTNFGGGPLPGSTDRKAWLVVPDKDRTPGSKAFLVYDNYKVIMKWNRSTYFATAVGMLADRIAAQ